AAAGSAAAGGAGVLLSPSFANGCANHQTNTQPQGGTSNGSGGAQGLLAQLPAGSPLNHCGGADLTGSQVLPAEDVLPQGNFQYALETSNGISALEQGVLAPLPT
ncbi:hypothetical protein GA0115259_111997, partial [Streptomyces sp. MnatMP-M17]